MIDNAPSPSSSPGADRPQRVVSNVLWNWAYWGLNLAAAFYVTPLLLLRLGLGSYGAWVLLGSILGYFSFLNLGIDTAILRYVSKHRGEARPDEAQRVIATGRSFFRFVALGVFALGAVLALALASLDGLLAESFESEASRRDAAEALAVLATGTALAVLGRVSVAVLRANERYDWLNGVNIGVLALRTLAIVILLDDSLLRLSLIFAAASGVGTLGFALAARKTCPESSSAAGFDKLTFRRVRGYGLFAFLNFVAEQLRFYSDALVIGYFLRMSAIAYFNVGNTLVSYFRSVIAQIAAPLLPVLSAQHGEGDRQALRGTFLRATRYTGFVTAIAAGNLLGSGRPFLDAWVGATLTDEGTRLAYQVMLVLLLPVALELVESVATNVVYAMNRHDRLFAINGVEALVNLALSLALVTRFGVLGVALGTALPLLVTRSLVLPRLACGLAEVSTTTYVRSCLAPPVLLGAVLGGIQLLTHDLVGTSGLLAVAGIAACTTGLSLPAAFYAYFDREERDAVRESAHRLVGRSRIPGALDDPEASST